MRTVKLSEDRISDFRKYYNKYSKEQDESFPVVDDYSIREDEPVYLLVDEKDSIHGAAAILLRKEYVEVKQARFRFFHCIQKSEEHYKMLLDEILKHTGKLNSIYAFIEENYGDTIKIWKSLGFNAQRYAWVLLRETGDSAGPEFAEGFELRTMRDGIDEDAWCGIINEAFEHTLGHTRLYPEKIDEWRKEDNYLSGGMKMLWDVKVNKPIATIAMINEDMNGEKIIFIDAVGVLNSFQGKGIGRNLIRAGIEFAKNYGSKKVMLSVNAENEKAAELYFNEGFKKDALYICYHYNIK
jgi:mycothiol synthase